jgi:hypothetical protein
MAELQVNMTGRGQETELRETRGGIRILDATLS